MMQHFIKKVLPGGTCRGGGEQGRERRKRPSTGGFQVKPQALHEPLGSPTGKMTPEFVPHQGASHTVTMDGVPWGREGRHVTPRHFQPSEGQGFPRA